MSHRLFSFLPLVRLVAFGMALALTWTASAWSPTAGRNLAPAFSAAPALPRALLALPQSTQEVSVAPPALLDRPFFPAPAQSLPVFDFPGAISPFAAPLPTREPVRAATLVGTVELRI